MAIRNFFDDLKDIIRDQTQLTPGLVKNLHGIIEAQRVLRASSKGQVWLAMTVNIDHAPTLKEFWDTFAYERSPYINLVAQDGEIVYPLSGRVPAQTAVTLYSTAHMKAPQTLQLEVTAKGYDIALYVGNARVSSGRDELSYSHQLDGGAHDVALVFYSGTGQIDVRFPTDIDFVPVEPMPPAPIWARPPEVQFMDAQSGSFLVDLAWFNDVFTPAWQVYRAVGSQVGTIASAVDNLDGVFDVTLAEPDEGEDPLPPPTVGAKLYTPDFFAGEVLKVDGSVVSVSLGKGASLDPGVWAELPLFVEGSYDSLARITYSGTPIIHWQDQGVIKDLMYFYKLTAFGPITGTVESDFSEVAFAWVRDRTSPDDITIDKWYIINGEMVVNYTPPLNDDYRGVRVFYEDPDDITVQTPIMQDLGLPGMPDELAFRPPDAGRYWFRTFDIAGNIQPVGHGVYIDWDGNSRFVNVLQPMLVAIINDNGTADLELTVSGPDELYPAQVEFYMESLVDPIDLGGGRTTHEIDADGLVTKVEEPAIGGLVIPSTGLVNFWAKVTDCNGSETWGYATSDKNTEPDGSVVPDDYTAFPMLICVYDEDVEEIEVTIPDDAGNKIGSVVWNRTTGGGMTPRGDGDVLVYTVGQDYDSILGGQDNEPPIPVDGVRGDYKVEFRGGGMSKVMWFGPLHGPASNPPTIATRISLDEVMQDKIDLYVTVESPQQEDVTLEVRSDEDIAMPIWQLTANGSTTKRWVTSGTELGPADYFNQTGEAFWTTKLNNIPLRQGQIGMYQVRATGKDSGVKSAWFQVALPLMQVPVITGVDLVFDGTQLKLTGTGGQFCKSAMFEISTDEEFDDPAVETMQEVALLSGQTKSLTKAIALTDRGKKWLGRVSPFNGPIQSGHVSGLGGVPVRDSVMVDEGTGPTGAVSLHTDAANNVIMVVTKDPVNPGLSFRYKTSTSGFDYDYNTGLSTLQAFGSLTTVSITVGTVAPNGNFFATVWFYADAAGTPPPGKPVVASLNSQANEPPRIEAVGQAIDFAFPDAAHGGYAPAVDLRVLVVDPAGESGTLKAWVAKTSAESPNFVDGSPDGTIAIPSTPYIIDKTRSWTLTLGGSDFLLHDVRSNAQKDKYVCFEFVTRSGRTSGKKQFKLIANLLDMAPDGTIPAGHIDAAKFAMGIKPVIFCSTSLPSSATEGDVAFLATDGKLYRYHSGTWTAAIPGSDISGNIPATKITDHSITTQQIMAEGAMFGYIAAAALNVHAANMKILTSEFIVAHSITAYELRVTELSELTDKLGIIVHGKLQNSTGTCWLDLDGTSGKFLRASNGYQETLVVYPDGSATFGGRVTTSSFEAAIATFNGIVANSTVIIRSVGALDMSTDFFATNSMWIYAAGSQNGNLFVGSNGVCAERLVPKVIQFYPYNGGYNGYMWRMQFDANTSGDDICLLYGSGGIFYEKGHLSNVGRWWVDDGYSTYSPKPPKAKDEMSPADWLEWAAKDARKPNWPHSDHGLPNAKHPEIIRRAEANGTSPNEEVEAARELYGKDISAIAIGVANWGDAVMQALGEAKTFAEFKRKLGF